MLDLVDETLNQMTFLIEMHIIVVWLQAILSGWNHGYSALHRNHVEKGLGIIALVGNEKVTAAIGQQGSALRNIMLLPRREQESQRIAQCIDGGVDFRTQPGAATPDRLDPGPLFSRLRYVDAHARWSNQ